MLTTISFLVLMFLSTVADTSRWTTQKTDEYRLEAAAENAIAVGVHSVWGSFDSFQVAGTSTTPWDFRIYLEGLGLEDQRDEEDPERFDLLPLVQLPQREAGGALGGIEIDALTVYRADIAYGSRLVFEARASARLGSGRMRRSVRQAFVIVRDDWEGLDFALLANNINCIICHASVDSAERFFGKDPMAYGGYDRVKVGSLESMQLRKSVDSWIAGTLYMQGRAYLEDGTPISNWSSRDFKSRAFDAQGHLLQDGFGQMSPSGFDPADHVSPAAGENLYLEYDESRGPLVDGFMPQSFPAVFPDDGGVDPISGAATSPGDAGNRKVDDSEFLAATSDADGTIAGGTINVLGAGDAINSSSKLGALLASGNTASLGSVTEGVVVLKGTQANPILIEGEVAIKGDVVIEGWVKGAGSLLISGNVYIPTDLKYADGTDGAGDRTFGVSSDGTQNALAIASGGNVMVGNIFHPRWGSGSVTGNDDGSFSFIMDELAIFNRQEWTKTQSYLPGKNQDPTKPATWTVKNPLYEGPDYLPRYYQFTEGSTVPVFNRDGWFDATSMSWKGHEHPGRWGTDRLTYADTTNPADPLLYAADGTPKAAVYKLTGNEGWITDALLRSMLEGKLKSRDEDQPLEIDALLYSNNSIFGIIPEKTRADGLDGKLVLNGGVVAADIGLLAPKQIQIRYDKRVKSLIDIPSDTSLTIRRELWAPLPN
jgi:hypothetical protein